MPPSDSYTDVFLTLISVPSVPPVFRIVSVNISTHIVTSLPPDSTVNVTPLVIVRGPVTFAFSVASIVMFAPNDCALVLNNPPPLKLPLFSAAGVMLPPANSKNIQRYCLSHLKELH